MYTRMRCTPNNNSIMSNVEMYEEKGKSYYLTGKKYRNLQYVFIVK